MQLRIAAALLSLLTALPVSARGIRCSTWDRLGPAEKSQEVSRLIDELMQGSGGREFGVNRASVARCLHRQSSNIQYEFDDICSEGKRAGMQALNSALKSYVWSCVN
jgi:hypothetical protein